MFGSRKRGAQAADAMREHVTAADIHARAVLADAIAQMELRLRDLEERSMLPAPVEVPVEPAPDLSPASADIARALGQVANMCAMVAERLEDDRLERRALTEALSRLARPAAPLDTTARAIGGTVFAPAGAAGAQEISLLDYDEDDEDDDDLDDDLINDEDLLRSDLRGDMHLPAPTPEAPNETSDYVMTVLERLTDVAYRQKERGSQP